MLSESLVETVAHDWADLGTAWEIGKEVHATYQHEMEATWGSDHLTTMPEDYAQYVILGVGMTSFLSCPLHLVLILPHCPSIIPFLSMFQALHLLHLATQLESRVLDLKCEVLESPFIGVGGTKAAAIWDEITGAFTLRKEPVIWPYVD